MPTEKINAGFPSERSVVKKEVYIVPADGNAVLAGFVKVWLDDGTTTLLSPFECGQHNITLPSVEGDVEKVEEAEEVKEEVPVEEPVPSPAEETAPEADSQDNV